MPDNPSSDATVALRDEPRLTLTEAARKLDKSPSTIWRWAMRGTRGVRLETFVLGAQRYTTNPAIDRFSDRCTAAANGEQPQARTPKQRSRDFQQAERELDRAGI